RLRNRSAGPATSLWWFCGSFSFSFSSYHFGSPHVASLVADVAGINALCDTHIGGSLDDGAAIRKNRQLVGSDFGAKRKVIHAHGPDSLQLLRQLFEVDRVPPIVDLDRISAAQTNGRAPLAFEETEFAPGTSWAIGVPLSSVDLHEISRPDIHHGHSRRDFVNVPRQDLDCIGSLQRTNHRSRRSQDARSFAALLHPARQVGNDAPQAAGFPGNDRHLHTVAAHGGAIDPRNVPTYRIVVD